MFTLTLEDFEKARARIAQHIKRTPLLTSRQLSERTGFDVRLKAELFQRVGSYKIRGPLNKFALMPEQQKRRGVVCSSAGNHAQGVALAARVPDPFFATAFFATAFFGPFFAASGLTAARFSRFAWL